MMKTRVEIGVDLTHFKNADEWVKKIEKKLIEQLQVVEVWWEDACAGVKNSSRSVSSVKDLDAPPVRSCGWLLDKNKERIVLTPMLEHTSSEDVDGDIYYRVYHIIPSGMIKKIIYLTPKRKLKKKKKLKRKKKKK